MKKTFINKLGIDKQALISKIVELRCQGLSYINISKELNTTEQFVYSSCFLLSDEAYKKNKPFLFLRLSLPITYKHLTISELANETGLSQKGLLCVLCDLKLLRRPSLDIVNKLLRKKKDFVYLCDYFGVNDKTMRKWLRDNGLMDSPIPRSKTCDLDFTEWKGTAFSFEEIVTKSGEEFNPQYSVDFDKISSNKDLLKAFHAECRILGREMLSRANVELTLHEEIEHFKMFYEFYSRWQYGIADPDNFFYNTMAVFKECSIPCRPADYVIRDHSDGKILTQYWFTKKNVVRGSTMWGRDIHYPGDCDWLFVDKEGVFLPINCGFEHRKYSERVYGTARWTDFVFKTKVVSSNKDEELVTSFCNTRFSDIHQYGNLNHPGHTIDKIAGFDRKFHFNF
ncbi:MAG: hypothetical protein Q4E54_05220 [Lachnospiraceae bacterium]|nr:hypothetical protein [Lachnospiraceae bacterium]